jgi:hypothetical protein
MSFKGGRENKNHRIKNHPAPTASYDQFRPVFSLRYQLPGYTVDQCDTDHKVAFLDAIHRRSQLKWMELRGVNHRQLGFEPLDRYVLENKGIKIPSEITEDSAILVFRCAINKMRVLGYRHEAVFEVKWIDRDGTMYDHD